MKCFDTITVHMSGKLKVQERYALHTMSWAPQSSQCRDIAIVYNSWKLYIVSITRHHMHIKPGHTFDSVVDHLQDDLACIIRVQLKFRDLIFSSVT
ncbi:uncharacterized protein LACBIDRAFT_318164 [Laccaria bicolor S238N-H82]|uniref:Predicted protein n=1 Tax=Laccaria bicolor (strain S238N-H82 / ATCC MYA-4686) TaxID=486041 RepID=B0D651_LACBS|nr:uncharacterized protein LACBIDRAFT_318164 [Laccaria bicolor S238N-H82]EDR09881.1 predicted protein [Laccaria bicolor S238N-H82]|eukprot:XP_001879266.1 predicted protein [Laccaria bicolor S238N-H82]